MSGLVTIPKQTGKPGSGRRRNILTGGPDLDAISMAGLINHGGPLPAFEKDGPREPRPRALNRHFEKDAAVASDLSGLAVPAVHRGPPSVPVKLGTADPAEPLEFETFGLPVPPDPRSGGVASPVDASSGDPRQVAQAAGPQAGQAPGRLPQTSGPPVRKSGLPATKKLPDGVLKTRPPTKNKVGKWEMFFELDFDPDGPTEGNLVGRDLAKNDVSDSAIAGSIGVRARALVAYRYGINLKPNTKKQVEADAFQHAYWSYLMTRAMGAEKAKLYGDAHERTSVNRPGSRLMDLYNNNIGRRLASDPRNKNRNPEQVVLDAMKRGELQAGHFSLLPDKGFEIP